MHVSRAHASRRLGALAVSAAAGLSLLAFGPAGAASAATSAARPATQTKPLHPAQFKGVNWADPRDNFANDAVVPSGLSTADSYSTTYAKAASILREFRRETGANTVRLPINPYSVGTPWWNSYTGAIDAASDLGFRVILSYWEGSGANADGFVDNMASWWSMWDTVTDRYGSDSHIYFDPMNEPHGYTSQQWRDLAVSWLDRYGSIPRNRVFVAGVGYDDHVADVCADPRLQGTYIALHDYAFWATHTYQGWIDDLHDRIGNCASRTVLEEFGVPMTTGIDYSGSSTGNDAATNNYVAFLQAATDTVRKLNMGSVYWPGLRTGDTYSLTTLHGTGTALTLSVNNRTGLSRLTFGWGNQK